MDQHRGGGGSEKVRLLICVDNGGGARGGEVKDDVTCSPASFGPRSKAALLEKHSYRLCKV